MQSTIRPIGPADLIITAHQAGQTVTTAPSIAAGQLARMASGCGDGRDRTWRKVTRVLLTRDRALPTITSIHLYKQQLVQSRGDRDEQRHQHADRGLHRGPERPRQLRHRVARVVWESIAPDGTTPTGHTQEWLGTTMEFDIVPADTGTELRFRHAGLTPQLECWDSCVAAWTYFMASVETFAKTSTGTPFGS